GSVQWSVAVPQRDVGRPLFLADGRFVLIEWGVFARRVQYWLVVRSGTTGKPEGESLPFALSLDREAVSPESRWVAGTKRDQLNVWSLPDLAKPPRVLKNGLRKSFTDLAFHPSGRYLAVSSNDTTVKLYDTATWTVAATYAWGLGKMRGVAF